VLRRQNSRRHSLCPSSRLRFVSLRGQPARRTRAPSPPSLRGPFTRLPPPPHPFLTSPAAWNLADKGDTDQGRISALLGGIFGIEVGFYGAMMSNLARMKMDSVVDDANSTHLAPWLALLKEAGIKTTPLSPFLHKQLLQNNPLTVDGAAIEGVGFKYAVPELTAEGLRDEVVQAISQGIFPVRDPLRGGGCGFADAGVNACADGCVVLGPPAQPVIVAVSCLPHAPMPSFPFPHIPLQPVLPGVAGPAAAGAGKA